MHKQTALAVLKDNYEMKILSKSKEDLDGDIPNKVLLHIFEEYYRERRKIENRRSEQ